MQEQLFLNSFDINNPEHKITLINKIINKYSINHFSKQVEENIDDIEFVNFDLSYFNPNKELFCNCNQLLNANNITIWCVTNMSNNIKYNICENCCKIFENITEKINCLLSLENQLKTHNLNELQKTLELCKKKFSEIDVNCGNNNEHGLNGENNLFYGINILHITKLFKYYQHGSKMYSYLTTFKKHIQLQKDLEDINIDYLKQKINDLKQDIINKECNKCVELNNICYECFKRENDIDYLTEQQKNALYSLLLNIEKSNLSGLYGCAGSGKTTLLKYFLNINNLDKILRLIELSKYEKYNDLGIEKKKNIKKILNKKISIIFSAPTNKALDVIYEKIGELDKFTIISENEGTINGISINFLTVAKLLSYSKKYDNKFQITFKRKQDYKNIFKIASLVFIDECSMLSSENIQNIKSDLEKNKFRIGHIVFCGDKIQLPPPKEKVSKIFNYVSKYVELKEIMRTKENSILILSQKIKNWNLGKLLNKDFPKILMGSKANNLIIFKDQNKFIDSFCEDGNILLVWTNKTREMYNNAIRLRKFGNVKETFIVGEKIILMNYYKIENDQMKKIYHTSSIFVIEKIKKNMNHICGRFDKNKMLGIIGEKLKKSHDVDLNKIAKIIEDFIYIFKNSNKNNLIFPIVEIYFQYKNKSEKYPLKILSNKKTYLKTIQFQKDNIVKYLDSIKIEIKDLLKEIIMNQFFEIFEQPFASIDYGYSMTVDKSQGSTFENVYIDSLDILDARRHKNLDMDVAKKRYYTAITRSSDRLNILF